MRLTACLLVLLLAACSRGQTSGPQTASLEARAEGEVVEPPFAVAGDAAGLLLVWLDEEGASHVAAKRDDIPAERREKVRVDSLGLEPDQRLDPAFVYVADLREAGANGRYTVRKLPREVFEARPRSGEADELAHPSGRPGGGNKTGQVVLYGASWCGACRQAAAYMRQQGIAFVEHDIEREPDARRAMQESCQRARIQCTGIPVLDVRGEVMQGFDPQALTRALAR